jgi:hypothetical protein
MGGPASDPRYPVTPSGLKSCADVRIRRRTAWRTRLADTFADSPHRSCRTVIVEVVDRPHRPAPYPDLTAFIDAAGGSVPTSRAEVAAATAAVLVQAGRDPDGATDDRFVALADRVGIDTLADLWRDSDPVSLPGALWALYLLRQWFRTSGDEVQRLWRAGAPLTPADTVVAGVAEPEDAESVARGADAILAGAYRGDFAVALERAAAAFRVIAAGRRAVAPEGDAGDPERALADRNDRAASDLATAAQLWRKGSLA